MQCRTDQLLLLLQSHEMGIGLPGTPAGEATRSVGHFQCFVLLLHLTFALERNLVCVCVCVVCVCVCVVCVCVLDTVCVCVCVCCVCVCVGHCVCVCYTCRHSQ